MADDIAEFFKRLEKPPSFDPDAIEHFNPLNQYAENILRAEDLENEELKFRTNVLKMVAKNNAERAKIFVELKYMKDEEGYKLLLESEELEKKVVDTEKEILRLGLEKQLALMDQIAETQRLLGPMGKHSREVLANTLKELREHNKELQKLFEEDKKDRATLEKAEGRVKEIESEIKATEEDMEHLAKDTEAYKRQKELLEGLKADRIAAAATEGKWKLISERSLRNYNEMKAGAADLSKEVEQQFAEWKKKYGKYHPVSEVLHIAGKIGTAFKDAGGTLSKANEKVAESYKALLGDFIENEELSPWLDKVVDLSEKNSKAAEARMVEQIEEYKRLAEKGDIDIMLKYAVKWNSPSFRLYANAIDEVKDLWEVQKWHDWLNPFKYIAWIGKFVAFVSKNVLAAIAAFIETLAWTLVGEAGSRIAVYIMEVTGIIGRFGLEVLELVLSWEVQAVLFLREAVNDLSKANNIQTYFDDQLREICTAGLGNYILGDVLIKEYPRVTELKSHKGKSSQQQAGRLDEMDSEENHMALNFWGEQYLKALKQQGYKVHPYSKWKPLKNRFVLPGQYIDLRNHPLETDEQVEECIQIESKLDFGELVNKDGDLVNDKGAHLILFKDYWPKRDHMVRNFTQFPIYQRSIVWPDKKGVYQATGGSFDPNEIDPQIREQFIKWAESGKWGPIYNTSQNAEVRKAAIETNKADLANFLKPQYEYPTSVLDIDAWVNGNNGKKRIMSESIFSMQADSFAKKWNYIPSQKTDHQYMGVETTNHSPGTVIVYDVNEYIFHSSDYVEEYKKKVGSYPVDKAARNFYYEVVKHKKYIFNRQEVKMIGTSAIITYKPDSRRATNFEVKHYSITFDMMRNYEKALKKKVQGINDAFELAAEETLWTLFLHDTSSTRTVWGYIKKHKVQFLEELQAQTKAAAGKNRAKVWKEWLNLLHRQSPPLNTDTYHQLQFMGNLNGLLFNEIPEMSNKVQKLLKDKMGPFLVDEVVSTGMSAGDLRTWAKLAKNVIWEKKSQDWTTILADIHCRIIVTAKPTYTMFVMFHGDEGFMEQVLKLDIDGADFNTLVQKPGGHWEISNLNKNEKKEKKKKEDEKNKKDLTPVDKRTIYTDMGTFMIHSGWSRAWKILKPGVIKVIDDTIKSKKYPLMNIIVSGYSVGASIAQVAMMEIPSFKRPHSDVWLRPNGYMYSSPTVGDSRFSTLYRTQAQTSINVYNENDLTCITPVLLLPNEDEWAETRRDYLAEFFALTGKEKGSLANIMASISLITGPTGLHLPKIFQPYEWLTPEGQLDMHKVQLNAVELFSAYNNYRAVRGGGLFIKMLSDSPGELEEKPYDMGVGVNGIHEIAKTVTGDKRLNSLHQLSTLMVNLDALAAKHPDLIADMDGKAPAWAPPTPPGPGPGPGPTPPPGPGPNPNPDPGPSPGPSHMDPIVKKYISQGTVIGFAHSKKRYRPWSIVPITDVDHETSVLFPFRIKAQQGVYKLHDRRQKIRKTTDDYL